MPRTRRLLQSRKTPVSPTRSIFSLAVSAKKRDPAGHLAAQGLALSPQSSIAEVADAIQRALESKARERKSHSDFAELSHNALVSAVTTHLTTGLGPLFAPTSAEVHGALSTLGRPSHFGQLAQTFFDHLSRSCLNVFLSKTLGSQIGAGHQFSTTAQVSQFEGAMAQHTREASEIVSRYCKEWFSKNLFEGNGDISKKKSTGFGWIALKKIRSEMKERAKPNAR